MEPVHQLIAIVFGTSVALSYIGVKAYGIWASRRTSSLDGRRIEELEERVAELEERADFAERVLTREPHKREIPPAVATPV